MTPPLIVRPIGFRRCRVAARRVRRAADGRRAIRGVRRPGLGPNRDRPPLAVVLFHAVREGRVVWESEEAFVIVEPPADLAAARLPGHWLVRRWDLLVLAVPAVAAIGAGLLLLPVSVTAALVALTGALGWIGLSLLVGTVRVAFALRANFRYGGRSGSAFLAGRIRSHQWTVVLCHADDPARARPLMAAAVRRAAALDKILRQPDDDPPAPMVPAFRAACVTTPEARAQVTGDPRLTFVGDPDWYFTRDPAGALPDRVTRPIPIVTVLTVAVGAVLTLVTMYVATTERVGPGAAASWLFGLLTWRFPGGFGWSSQALGIAATALVCAAPAVLAASVHWHLRYQRARTARIRAAHAAHGRTVLVLVVNDVEHAAAVEAFQAVADDAAAVYRATAGTAQVVLARTGQGAAAAGSATRRLIDEHRPVAVVLTGVGYGLDPGRQALGDVMVATQVHIGDWRKVTDAGGGERQVIFRGPRPETSRDLRERADHLAASWPVPVHRGPMVSISTLVNLPGERDEIAREHPEAIGGEMEAAGVYDVVAGTTIGWIVVKGVSDWAAGKSDGHQRAAARHAAAFAAALIVSGSGDGRGSG